MKRNRLSNIDRVCVLLLILTPLLATADKYIARNGTNTDTWPYDGWPNAASNIQDAVNAATNGATIWVQAGIYTASANPTNYPVGSNPNVVYINKPVTLRSQSGNPEDTIIDGEKANRCLAWYSTASSQPFVLDGFTIRNGLANQNGGGILVEGSGWTNTIRNCLIQNNMATNALLRMFGGGGMYVGTTPYVLTNCTFRGNMVSNTTPFDSGGGGLCVNGSSLGQIYNCLFESNSVYNGGGGGLMFAETSVNKIRNTTIVRNSQRRNVESGEIGGGGLMHKYGAKLSLWNCLITENQAIHFGNAIYNNKAGSLELYNCTVTRNSGTISSGYATVQTRGRSDCLVMVNSIIYGNTTRDILIGTPSAGTYSYFHYSCFPTNPALDASVILVAGNLTNAPSFVDAAAGNYHLKPLSPCLNVGTNQLDWMIGAKDLEGNPRIDALFGIVDMGCYETVNLGTLITIR